ncbi:MAG: aminotransferase class III-fold pyridoxal phosphate-dependent enzyme, partial [Propionibacteriaceae bacterium]|nr:aminotransferase class III-fold pyridoxal phosphate-dependent enzyme [Propionibacteriaceae bacterium]
VGHAVVKLLESGEFQQRAVTLGAQLSAGLESLAGEGLKSVRTRGLWAGIDIDERVATGRQVTERMLARGVLAKEAHGQTVRFAPPLVATEDDIDLLLDVLGSALADRLAA